MRQYYKLHLKTVHEDESGDLREWGQSSLTYFSTKRQPLKEDVTDDGDNFPVTEDGEILPVTDNSTEGMEGIEESIEEIEDGIEDTENNTVDIQNDKRRQHYESSRSRSRSPLERNTRTARSVSKSESEDSASERSSRSNEQRSKIEDLEGRLERIYDTTDILNDKVDAIIQKIRVKVEVSQCHNNQFEQMGQKLDVIKKFVDMNEGLRNGNELQKIFQDSCSTHEKATMSEVKEDDLMLAFRKCSSIDDIQNKFQEIKYCEQEENFKCELCKRKVSSYPSHLRG